MAVFPAAVQTVRFPREVGWGNAMRYMLTGDHWGAQEALRMGEVQEIAPNKEAALDVAIRIAHQSGRPAAPWASRPPWLRRIWRATAASRKPSPRWAKHITRFIPPAIFRKAATPKPRTGRPIISAAKRSPNSAHQLVEAAGPAWVLAFSPIDMDNQSLDSSRRKCEPCAERRQRGLASASWPRDGRREGGSILFAMPVLPDSGSIYQNCHSTPDPCLAACPPLLRSAPWRWWSFPSRCPPDGRQK